MVGDSHGGGSGIGLDYPIICDIDVLINGDDAVINEGTEELVVATVKDWTRGYYRRSMTASAELVIPGKCCVQAVLLSKTKGRSVCYSEDSGRIARDHEIQDVGS
ncbi:hypothetical protein BpHYR1_005822 [Brachionus plicatilis]|uniref:Uncharacterized protein n=1 Tax=Brachionus plicatilis TaxID=10195 RepID=A0A3M7PIM6_BRAPC|nr:hypothetical protein BpHYR1_005822 [Brachionus plicatilis]